jgi:hypothetical protein
MLVAGLFTTATGCLAPAAATQQFVVEEAIAGDPGACYLEGWHGSTSSWVLPACQLSPRLELAGGAGRVLTDGERAWEYVLQAKVLLHEGGDDSFSIGLVAGMGLDPFAGRNGRRVPGVYAHVPLTRPLAGGAVRAHTNLGWSLWRELPSTAEEASAQHSILWGARADFEIRERVEWLMEVFGDGWVRPEYHAGLRIGLTDRLSVDLSYGGRLERDLRGMGWGLGVSLALPSYPLAADHLRKSTCSRIC